MKTGNSGTTEIVFVPIGFEFQIGVAGWRLAWLALMVVCLSAEAASYDVGVFDYFFEPFELTVHTGDTVVWTAYGFDHTVISDTDIFTSFSVWPTAIGVLKSYKYTFHEPGTFPYYCADHGGPEGAGMSGTIFVTGLATNQIPAAPVNRTPPDGATNVPINVELRASAFADGDAGDLHSASQWLVQRAADNQIVYDSGEVFDNGGVSDSRTNFFLPNGLLNYGAAYDWQVRYKDNDGTWSGYSPVTSFSTAPPVLRAIRQSTAIVFFWPTNTDGFALEFSTNLAPANWLPASPAPQVIGGQNILTNNFADKARMYRLKKT